jgi:hypothetical protein
MTDETAAMRAWLDAHGLAEAELLHHLANHGPDGSELLTDAERRLLSALLETRRTLVPGYRPPPTDRPTTQDRPDPAAPLGLFDPDATRPPQRAAVEPAGRHTRPPVRPAARRHALPPPAQRPRQRDRVEERER